MQVEEEKAGVPMEAGTTVRRRPQATGHLGPPDRVGRAGPRAFGGDAACRHLSFGALRLIRDFGPPAL